MKKTFIEIKNASLKIIFKLQNLLKIQNPDGLSVKRNIIFHTFIVIGIIFIDQLSKLSSLYISKAYYEGGFLGFSLGSPIKNYNLIFGWQISSGDSVFVNLFFSVILCLFLFYYVLSLVMIPRKFYYLQTGFSILFAGFSSNLINKLLNGYTLDFIRWSPFSTLNIYFNLADLFQNLAWLIILSQLFLLRKGLWRIDERRKHIFIKNSQQIQFIAYSALTFLCISLFILIFNHQILSFVGFDTVSNVKRSTYPFIKYSIFLLIILFLFIGIFFLYLSNKIYGPIYAFEKYVRALLKGKNPEDFKLRKDDQFKNLEFLAKDLKKRLLNSSKK